MSSWNQLGNTIIGESAGDRAGSSVSLSSDGTVVAIGATKAGGNGNNSGHTRLYQWNGTAWVQLGNDIDGEYPLDYSGGSVSLSSDGTLVAIGAYLNDGNGNSSGHTRLYQWNGTAWVQLGNDINGEAPFDNSGNSVSLSSDGTVVAIGAYLNDGGRDNSDVGIGGSNFGHTRVYQNDFISPTLSSSIPADNATAVAVGSNIVLNFSEVVNLSLIHI